MTLNRKIAPVIPLWPEVISGHNFSNSLLTITSDRNMKMIPVKYTLNKLGVKKNVEKVSCKTYRNSISNIYHFLLSWLFTATFLLSQFLR